MLARRRPAAVRWNARKPLNSDEKIEEIKAVVDWYRQFPEDLKRYVTFRHERMQDPAVADLYHTLAAAKKLSKMWKELE